MVENQILEVLDGLEVVNLEDGRLGCRVGDQVLEGNLPNLRVGVGNEAGELRGLAGGRQRARVSMRVRNGTSSSSDGILAVCEVVDVESNLFSPVAIGVGGAVKVRGAGVGGSVIRQTRRLLESSTACTA